MANPLYDALFGRHTGRKTAFLHLTDDQTVSHDAFLRMAARFAHTLSALGLSAGDRVAVQTEKSAESLAVYAACVQTGTIFLPLNTAYTADEVAYFVKDSGAKLVICDDANHLQIAPIAMACGASLATLNANGSGTFADQAASMPEVFETVDRAEDDLAAFLYTSGTTGRSKGAMLTQGNLLSNAKTLVDIWRFTADDVLLHALPIFHTHGLFVATNVILLSGGAMIFMPKFDLDFIAANIHRATTMMGVPTFYTRLVDDPRFSKEPVGHMRLFTSGSAPLLAETHARFFAQTGHHILERYGMTETNMNTSNPYDGERRPGTVGFPLPGVELKITDSAGNELAQGEIGVIEVRGPNVFKGYWQMPEKTAEELRADGFFITGDFGRIDEDGYVHIVGRNKDLIISGGYNIYPKEIELLLDEQPGIAESAVIGVPHPDLGETVMGIIVAQKGVDVDLDAVSAAISQSLARFKQPKKLVLVAELPRNTMGKVQKNMLRQQFENEFTARLA